MALKKVSQTPVEQDNSVVVEGDVQVTPTVEVEVAEEVSSGIDVDTSEEDTEDLEDADIGNIFDDSVDLEDYQDSSESSEYDIEVSVPEDSKNDVTVDMDKTQVNVSSKPKDMVKIRMRYNHRCTIAMVQYDLKEGKTYTVPANVKRILNRAGVLSPL